MKAVVRVTTIMIEGKPVYRMARRAYRETTRLFDLRYRKPPLTDDTKLRRVFDALGKGAE